METFIHRTWVLLIAAAEIITSQRTDTSASRQGRNGVSITNNNFREFVNFFDCWYENEVTIENNKFQKGTNLLGSPHNIPVTFDIEPAIKVNIGQLDFNTEGEKLRIEELARELNPVIRGLINYYCKFWSYHTQLLWHQLNMRLQKWVQWEKGLYQMASARWLRKKCDERLGLFAQWKLVHP